MGSLDAPYQDDLPFLGALHVVAPSADEAVRILEGSNLDRQTYGGWPLEGLVACLGLLASPYLRLVVLLEEVVGVLGLRLPPGVLEGSREL